MKFRRLFALPVGAGGEMQPGDVLREQTRRFTAAQALIHGFYAFILYLAIAQMTEIPVDAAHSTFHPLWPVAWLPGGHFTEAVRAIFFAFLATSILGAALPGSRVVRVLTFLGLLEYVALKNSYGKIGHSMHLPLLVSLLLVFLPGGWHWPAARTTRTLRQGTLLVFWLCGAAILLAYTMSGIGKLGGAIYQIARLEPNAFTPGGLGAHIAERLLETDSRSLLGAWIIEHPFLTWPAMPFAIYIEFFSILIAFRPALSRIWAVALVIFHVGNYFTMTIAFPPSCFLLALFFFASPFDPWNTPPRALLFHIPALGDVLHWWRSPRRGKAHKDTRAAASDLPER